MTERSDERAGLSLGGLVRAAAERYEISALVVVMAYMLWVRTRSYERFVRDGEIFFRGNDPYYHLREVTYTVKHWPATMPYDPWTYYPYGASADQFGTLFDQLIATAALVWGLGDPSQTTIMKTMLLAPPVFGTLVAIPMYFIGRRLGGRFGGVFGIVVLALLPGTFLTRSLVGAVDHHVAEALFQAIAVLGLMVALSVAEREKPVYELLVDRDFETLRGPLGWGALAGVAMALYIWTWPPGVLLFAITGAFFTVKLTAAYLNGDSPEPVAFAGATSMGVAGVLSLVPLNSLEISATSFGLLQPGLAFAVAAGCVFLSWLAREFDARDFDRRLFPVTVFGLLLGGIVVLMVVLPDVFSLFANNFKRFIGFSAGAETRTIGEAQPFFSRTQFYSGVNNFELVFMEYGAMFFVALGSMGFILLKPLLLARDTRKQYAAIGALVVVGATWQFKIGPAMEKALPLITEPVLWEMAIVAAAILVVVLLGDHAPEKLFVVVWGLFITAAAFTQARFNYYLALVVVAMTAYAVGQFMELLGIISESGEIRTDVEPYQVMALMLALLVVLPGLVVSVQVGGTERSPTTTTPSWEKGNRSAPSRGIVNWDSTLEWMQNNTPKEGRLGGSKGSMEYYGTYRVPPDGDFDYENGTYGVMSWWDYGHWITVEGRRIPNANPFQQGATTAANYLLAPNESRANAILERLGEGGEQTRYVMVDWKMVAPGSKFTAPVVFYTDSNVSANDFVQPVYKRTRRGFQRAIYYKSERYFKSLMVRLYKFHGSAVEPQPLVLQWDRTGTSPNGRKFKVRQGPVVKRFKTMQAARAYARNHTNAQVGGFGTVPPEYIPALQHYRLVKASSASATSSRAYLNSLLRPLRLVRNVSQGQLIRHPQWVKVFERVPGATLRGTGAPPNSTVTVSVQMRMLTTNKTFVYKQRAETGPDGTFTVTVPYSTTGYENFGPKNGYTNVSVRATGPYSVSTGLQRKNNTTFVTYRAAVNVSEAHVLGVNDTTIRFNMTKREVDFGQPGGNNSTGTNNSTKPTGTPTPGAGDGGTNNTSAVAGELPASYGPSPKLPERDSSSGLPGGDLTRGSLLLLLLAGLVAETRD